MMWRSIIRIVVLPTVLSICWCSEIGATDHSRDDQTIAAFRLLTRNSIWERTQVVKMHFETFHTQGLVKIGDTFYVSAVETRDPRLITGVTDALFDFSIDRTPGTGRAWLFMFTENGDLLSRLELTQNILYHPGGLDYDGSHIWVTVAEYRPNSSSIVYRINPETLETKEVFRVNDHIGGIVHNLKRGTLHGISWGSRRLYEWTYRQTADGQLQVQSESWRPNPEHYIDYQDCHSVGVGYMLCGGLNRYNTPVGNVAVGGIDLVDLSGQHPRLEHQIPVTEYVDDRPEATLENWVPANPELVATNNAYWVEPIENGESAGSGKKLLRFYFMTEKDNQADLLIYDVAAPFLPVPTR